MKRRLSIAVRLVISVVLMALLFREHSFVSDIVPRLGALLQNWPWVLAGLSTAFLGLMCCATRWFIILRGQAPEISWRFLARTEIVAAFFNISTVGVVGGDACKILSVSRRLKGRTAQVGVSLMLDHATGFVAVGVLFFTCFAFVWPRWEALGRDARVLLAGFSTVMGVSLAGMVFAWFTFKPRVLAWGQRTFPRVLGTPMFGKLADKLIVTHYVILALWRRALAAVFVSFG
ncbi:MAG: flippase-like domain-containing protein, partial [Verrucomicrobiaceae bacterium]|nr:flippase-like domain-containing protein [Verrucomicrobiaceae bacterium]